MLTMTPPDVPIATEAKRLLLAAQERNTTPERWEILFGEGTTQALARVGNLRIIGGLQRIYDLPVSFPERPGPRPDFVELILHGQRRDGSEGYQIGIPIESLTT
jgi:hypothetical protein